MDNCLTQISYNSSNIIFDECQNTYSIWQQQDKEFTKENLTTIANDCFELSKQRLRVDSDLDVAIGKSVFDDLTNKLSNLVVEFDPISFGFSVSLEPSLHYIARFKRDITMFFETYIDFKDGLETYLQVFEGKEPILSIRDTIPNALFYAEEKLSEKINNRTLHF